MPTFHLLVLALVQGITEFLPISSSAHLILMPRLMQWQDQGPLIDVMAHVGTLAAVLLYFRKDVANMTGGGVDLLRGRMTPGARLALMLIVATPPALILGGVLYATGLVDLIRDPSLIAWTTLLFAIPLWLSDRYARADRTLQQFTLKDAALTGLAQALSLIPGVSRSGITMTAGRGLGLARRESAHFSMLLSIPLLLAFGAVAGLDLANGGPDASLADGLMVAALSFVSALVVIALLMRLVERIGFLPFVVYRIALAVLLFALFGWRIDG